MVKEKDFQREFTRSIRIALNAKQEYYVYHKLSDMSIDQKPFDCFLAYKHWFMWFELKIHKKSTAFAVNKIEDHQLYYLTQLEKAGHTWYIIVNVRVAGSRSDHSNFASVYRIGTWNKLVESLDRKSIPVDMLMEKADFVLLRIRQLWEVDKMLKL